VTPAREIPAWRNVRAAVIVEAEQMPIPFQPMPLRRRSLPFDDPDCFFELKYDGFRALAVIEHGRAQLLSRNGHPFASFSELGKEIAAALPSVRAIVDGRYSNEARAERKHYQKLLQRCREMLATINRR